MSGKPAPYEAKDGGGIPGKGLEKGFGNVGDKNLIYQPQVATDADEEKKYYPTFKGGESSTVWKMPNQKFFDKTKNMPLPEFVKYVKSYLSVENSNDIPSVYAYKEGNFLPDPIQAIRYIGFLTSVNENLLESLILELKRSGSLKEAVKLSLKHDEVYSEVALSLSHPENGEHNRRRLDEFLKKINYTKEILS
jgi:hypothetical protein